MEILRRCALTLLHWEPPPGSFFFFFSSRRRHTRWNCDWSSDGALPISGERRILETTPTGGGKSRIICGLIEWAVGEGFLVPLYTNRRLLIDQLSRVLTAAGIRFGVRSARSEERRVGKEGRSRWSP